MKVAVWRTGHEIADTVAKACYEGLPDSFTQIFHTDTTFCFPPADAHIAYGILRGTDETFRECDTLSKPWFNIDKGYFNAHHFDGYYRISLRGTQQVTGLDTFAPDYDRLRRLNVHIKPWRGFDKSKPVLVCPPTEHVSKYFGIDKWTYINASFDYPNSGLLWREKGNLAPINFDDYSYILTFNSSVGWQALAAGIPCISDPNHSIVGSWFKSLSIDSLSKAQETDRERLFGVMANLQLTLDEIRSGKLWGLIQTLLSTSGSMAESPNAATSLLTAS